MTNLTRWEPFNDVLKLNTALDQLFKSAVVPTFGLGNQSLPIDIIENENAYTMQVVVPGINPNDLDITVNDQTLTIRGEWKQSELPEGTTFHLRERSTGLFQRTVRFPLSLNADAVQAQYEHGILSLTLPKAESVKPRRISVQSQPRQIETMQQPVLEEQQVAA